jgi:hypothetical protein
MDRKAVVLGRKERLHERVTGAQQCFGLRLFGITALDHKHGLMHRSAGFQRRLNRSLI